jgi:peptidoglycan/xylan/chitin deacetylase (PgdA/CDA1 family)
MDIIIVCHTEFGFVSDKKFIPDKNRKEGVTAGVNNLVSLAERHKAKITFAVMPEAARDFPRDTGHEIGLHIHSGWQKFHLNGLNFDVGDAYLRKNCRQSSNSTVLRDFSYEEQSGMIIAGKELLERELGVEPKVFVAGRWSINNETVKVLVEQGFTHECSAPAHAKSDYFDWSQIPRICLPYHPDKDNYQKKGDLPLLIAPISQFFRLGNVTPEVIGRVGLSWLKASFQEYYRQGVPLFHICLHSPVMTDSYYISAMDELIGHIARHKNINFKFASEIKEYPAKNYRTDIFPYLLNVNGEIFKRIFTRLKHQACNTG